VATEGHFKVFENPTSWTCAYGHLRSIYDAMPLRGSIYNHCVLSKNLPFHKSPEPCSVHKGSPERKKTRWGHTLADEGSIYGAMPLRGSIYSHCVLSKLSIAENFIDLVHCTSHSQHMMDDIAKVANLSKWS
jgi:hypothetical protein